jgi:hypothetical protein
MIGACVFARLLADGGELALLLIDESSHELDRNGAAKP